MRDSRRFLEALEEALCNGYPVRFRAEGWSMHPTIRHGEIITVAPLGRSSIRIGDVLLYRRGHAVVVHRMIQRLLSSERSTRFVLRGDAAVCCDRPITRAQILGRVQTVEREGRTLRVGLFSRTWLLAIARAISHTVQSF